MPHHLAGAAAHHHNVATPQPGCLRQLPCGVRRLLPHLFQQVGALYLMNDPSQDVYKRQPLLLRVDVALRRQLLIGILHGDDADPVSYTHLHGHYTELKQKNIDTGMGLERLACVCQNLSLIHILSLHGRPSACPTTRRMIWGICVEDTTVMRPFSS